MSLTALNDNDITWGCPGSRLLLPVDAPREEWLEKRKMGVGGSDYGVLLGMAPPSWNTPFKLWQIKTGRAPDAAATAYMERGADLEPTIRRKFEEKTGLKTRRAGLQQSKADPRLLFSPDALVEDGAIAEFKLVSVFGRDKWIDRETGERRPPALYEWQVRMGMAVTGRKKGYIAALDADTWELEIFEVYPRSMDLDFIAVIVNGFWHHVETDTPPPIDFAQADEAEMLDRYPEIIDPGSIVEAEDPDALLADLAEYERLTAIISAGNEAEKARSKLKLRWQAVIGEREYVGVREGGAILPDGTVEGGRLRPIFRWKRRKKTQLRQADLKEQRPEIYEEFVDRSETRQFEVAKPAKPSRKKTAKPGPSTPTQKEDVL